jgi:hypothetical protein
VKIEQLLQKRWGSFRTLERLFSFACANYMAPRISIDSSCISQCNGVLKMHSSSSVGVEKKQVKY